MLSEPGRTCQELPQAVINCNEVLGDYVGYQKLSVFCRSCNELSGAARIFQEMTCKGPDQVCVLSSSQSQEDRACQVSVGRTHTHQE